MNLLLLSEEDFVAVSRVRLTGRRARHVLEVHRAERGDRLRVGVLGGLLGTAVVTDLDAEGIELEVALAEPPPPPLPLTLLLALPRPKTLRRVIQAVTTSGVKRLFLVNTWRVEKSFWASPSLERDALVEQMVLGLEQARDTVLPTVEIRRRFKPFVEDELPGIAQGTLALVADPDATAPCPRAVNGPVTLAVGPEGGFSRYEVEKLGEAGFLAVSLGPRRLRVEQAVATLLGRIC